MQSLEGDENSSIFMFPRVNRYKCLKSEGVLLQNETEKCMGLTPMRSEKCLNELENKYEYDIVLNGQGHYAYNISSSK